MTDLAVETEATTTAGRVPRMTLSRVVEMLLERRDVGSSSVTLVRNAKGETQIEVVVRTCDNVPAAEDAESVAQAVFERLRARYPLSSGLVSATPNGTATAAQREA
jgi:hypothetical protein